MRTINSIPFFTFQLQLKNKIQKKWQQQKVGRRLQSWQDKMAKIEEKGMYKAAKVEQRHKMEMEKSSS